MKKLKQIGLFLRRLILFIFGKNKIKMSKIKLSKNGKTVMIEEGAHKISSLTGAREYYRTKQKDAGIMVTKQNDRFRISYDDKDERKSDLDFLTNLLSK